MTRRSARIYWPALQRAADLIRKRGWCQRAYARVDGRLCMLGAINTLPIGNPEAVKDHLKTYLGTRIYTWNDRRGRTKRQVIAALERAARTP
jgi:hypothetical protein